MNYRRSVFTVIFLVALVLVLPALLVLYVDPFQVFHTAYLQKMGLRENQRYQNAGLINSYLADPAMAYDSIALGSSMSANVTSEGVAKSFGWQKTIRLFIKGGGPAETLPTIESALRTKKAKHLLWEINPWFQLESYQSSISNEDFPHYLYNAHRLDDARYLFNWDVLHASILLLSGYRLDNYLTPETLGQHTKEAERHDIFNTWLAERLQQSSALFVKLEPWPEAQRQALSLPLVGRDVFPIIDRLCNGDMEVVLYLPPLSKLYYAEQGVAAYPVIYMPRKILERIQPCANMRLHAFDLMPFTADMNHYRDFMHYTKVVNDNLLHMMAKGEQQLRLEKISAYEDEWIRQLNTHHIHTSYQK